MLFLHKIYEMPVNKQVFYFAKCVGLVIIFSSLFEWRIEMVVKKIFFTVLAGTIFFTSQNVFADELDKKTFIDLEIKKTVQTLQKKDLPLSLETRYFSPRISANLNTANVNLNGDTLALKKINLVNDNIPEIIFRYKNFSVDYLQMHKSGGANLSGENLTFGKKNFFGDISAKNNLHYIKLSVDNEIISLMGTGAFWSYGLTGIYYDGKAENFSDAKHQSYFIPMPTAGLGLYMTIMPKMKIYSQFSGIFLGGRGHLHDFEAGLKYSPSKNFTLTTGFRSVEFNLNHKGNGDFKMNGPFIGIRSDF